MPENNQSNQLNTKKPVTAGQVREKCSEWAVLPVAEQAGKAGCFETCRRRQKPDVCGKVMF